MRKISRRARPSTITLYNYLGTTLGAAVYQATVINRVYLDTAYQQRRSQRGIAPADTAQLVIDLRDIDVTADRAFLPYAAWAQLDVLDKALYFTFATANDFFVAGVAAETLPPATKKDMITKYSCISVTSVAVPASDKDGPIMLEVTGK